MKNIPFEYSPDRYRRDRGKGIRQRQVRHEHYDKIKREEFICPLINFWLGYWK